MVELDTWLPFNIDLLTRQEIIHNHLIYLRNNGDDSKVYAAIDIGLEEGVVKILPMFHPIKKAEDNKLLLAALLTDADHWEILIKKRSNRTEGNRVRDIIL